MQLTEWDKNGAIKCMDPDILRLYCFLARRTDQEAKLFVAGAVDVGWRGRISMNPGSRIEEIVANFEAEVARGDTPKPVPSWQEENGEFDGDDTCIIYNVMKLHLSKGGKEGSFGKSLASVVASKGYSREGDMR